MSRQALLALLLVAPCAVLDAAELSYPYPKTGSPQNDSTDTETGPPSAIASSRIAAAPSSNFFSPVVPAA